MTHPIDQSYYDKRDAIKRELESLDSESTYAAADREKQLRTELMEINEEIEEVLSQISEETREGR